MKVKKLNLIYLKSKTMGANLEARETRMTAIVKSIEHLNFYTFNFHTFILLSI